MKTRRQLSFDALEGRQLLSRFIGPLVDESLRAIYSDVVASPTIVKGMTFAWPNNKPQLGVGVTATLDYVAGPVEWATSTKWSVSISYKGATTPPTFQNGNLLSLSRDAVVPGTYTFTAVTTYSGKNPSAIHGPTTVTGTFTVPPATTTIKGGQLSTPVPNSTAIEILDTITDGSLPIGGRVAAVAQERITAKWYGGFSPGTTAWYPPDGQPSVQFYLYGGQIHDHFMCALGSAGGVLGKTPPNWADVPIGATIVTFTQELRLAWRMSDMVTGNNLSFNSTLTTLTWTWVKVDATHWEAK